MGAAVQAIQSLKKADLTELKAYASPPIAVLTLMKTIGILFGQKDTSWTSSKLLLGNNNLMNNLISFDKDNVDPKVIAKVRPYLEQSDFTLESMKSVSRAAGSLRHWVVGIVQFHDIRENIKAKQAVLQAAKA